MMKIILVPSSIRKTYTVINKFQIIKKEMVDFLKHCLETGGFFYTKHGRELRSDLDGMYSIYESLPRDLKPDINRLPLSGLHTGLLFTQLYNASTYNFNYYCINVHFTHAVLLYFPEWDI